MMLLLKLSLALLLAILPATVAHADVCTLEQIKQRYANLPEFIMIEEGMDPSDALAKALNCNQVILSTEQQSTASPSPIPPEIEKAQVALGTAQGAVASAQSAATQHENPQQAVAVQGALRQAQGAMQQAQGAMEQAQAVIQPTSFEFRQLFQFRLLPTDREVVLIRSQPEGASIYITGRMRGVTSVRASVNKASLQTIRLEMKGYAPCSFSNGKYVTQEQDQQEAASFECTLSALN